MIDRNYYLTNGAAGKNVNRSVSAGSIFLFSAVALICYTQNLMALATHAISLELMFTCLVLKDIIIAFVVFFAYSERIISGKSISRPEIAVFSLILLTLLYIPISPMFNVRQLRVLLNLHVLFLFGFALSRFLKIENLKSFTIAILTVVAISGYAEYFFLHDENESFWQLIRFRDYYIQREGTSLNIGNAGAAVPGNFFTHDYYKYFGFKFRRMVSLFIFDPLLFGHAMALPFVYFWSKRSFIWTLFFGGAILFTFSKGAWLAALLAIAFIESGRGGKSGRKPIALYALVGGLLLFLGRLLLESSSSIQNHSDGILGGFKSLADNPIGKGIGTGGNLALRALRKIHGTANVSFSEFGAESYFASSVVQTGFVAFVSYLAFGYMIWKINRQHASIWTLAVRSAALATWIAGFGAETPISLVGSGVLFVLAAIAYMESNNIYKPDYIQRPARLMKISSAGT